MHIILVSSADTKQDQSLFALHLAVGLSEKFKVAFIGCDTSFDIVHSFTKKRNENCNLHHIELPTPIFFTYREKILEELGQDFQFAVISTQDLSLAQYCDTLITLVSSNKGIIALTSEDSSYAKQIWESRQKHTALKHKPFRMFVLADDVTLHEQLRKKASQTGYRLAPVFQNSQVYPEALTTGITVFDKNLPCFLNLFGEKDFFARRNLKRIIEYLFSDR